MKMRGDGFAAVRAAVLCVIMAALTLALPAYEGYDGFQRVTTALGGVRVVNIAGLMLARPISVDLAPADAPRRCLLGGLKYSVGLQVVYVNHDMPTIPDAAAFLTVQNVDQYLNDLLADFMKARHVGVEWADLVARFASGVLADEVMSEFPAYVAAALAALPEGERPNIEVKTVQVFAEGALRTELMRRHYLGGESRAL